MEEARLKTDYTPFCSMYQGLSHRRACLVEVLPPDSWSSGQTSEWSEAAVHRHTSAAELGGGWCTNGGRDVTQSIYLVVDDDSYAAACCTRFSSCSSSSSSSLSLFLCAAPPATTTCFLRLRRIPPPPPAAHLLPRTAAATRHSG